MTRRTRRNLLLGLLAFLLILFVFWAVGFSPETWVDIPDRKADSPHWRLSMSLAYTALVFLAATLAIGPLTVIRKRPIPTHHMLRRDIAIWAALLGLSHMAVGMLVHTDGLQIWTLFITGLPDSQNLLPVRGGVFGLANYTGLLQGTILFVLLMLSNDAALRRLGAKRWKAWQRLSYVGIASIVVHGLSYQTIERRELAIRLAFLAITSVIVALQLTGLILRLGRKQAGVTGRPNLSNAAGEQPAGSTRREHIKPPGRRPAAAPPLHKFGEE